MYIYTYMYAYIMYVHIQTINSKNRLYEFVSYWGILQ